MANEPLSERERDAVERYQMAMHGVQTAILFEIERCGQGVAGATPKHLRTGINSAMVNDKAISDLLIEKGIITREEYLLKIAMTAEEELATMTSRVRASTGVHNVRFA